MRAFSELAPGDLFIWQSATWRKVYPVAHAELRYAPPYNAMKVDKEPAVEGVIVPPTYRTFAGWPVMVEPSDVAELAPVTPTEAFAQVSEEFGHLFAEVQP